jgi:hypothetical protein
MFDSMGKEGFEPSRLSARDSKSRLSANSSTSPEYHPLGANDYILVQSNRQQIVYNPTLKEIMI